MKVYKAYVEEGIEELGELNLDLIPHLLEESASTTEGDSFSVGVSRTKNDFIEVAFVGKDQYLVWSDRLCKTGSFWQRLNQKRNIEKVVTGKAQALEAIKVYVNETRTEFEVAYS